MRSILYATSADYVLSGFVATFSYTSGKLPPLLLIKLHLNSFLDQSPKYIRGHSITLAFVVMAWVFMAANVFVSSGVLSARLLTDYS